jgi:hypothetical protein
MQEALEVHGHVRCATHELRSLFVALYGTTDLEEVQLVEPPVAASTPLIALGNPLEAIVLYNWTGRCPIYTRRIWWTTPGARLVAGSHVPRTASALLAEVALDAWSGRPSVVPVQTAGRRAPVLTDDHDHHRAFVCLDGLLLAPQAGRIWRGWHPAVWDNRPLGGGGGGGARAAAASGSPAVARAGDFWQTRRAIRDAVVRVLAVDHESDLALFDDSGILSVRHVPAVLRAAGLPPSAARGFLVPTVGGDWVRQQLEGIGMSRRPETSHVRGNGPLGMICHTPLPPPFQL